MLIQCDECREWYKETQEHHGPICPECKETELIKKGEDYANEMSKIESN